MEWSNRVPRIIARWVSVTLLVGTFARGTLAANQPITPARYSLLVGETREIDLGVATDLVVSRRGVVDIQHVAEGRWRVTGLRKGFVAVRLQKSDMPSAPRFFARVTAPDDVKSSERPAGKVPRWLCAPTGILCDESSGMISGEAPSAEWLRRASEYCAERRDCMVDADLGPEARQEADLQYRLKARAFLLDDSEAEEFGLSHSLSGEADWISGARTIAALTKIQARLSRDGRRRVAEPVIRARAGVSVKVMTGGELAVRDKVDQKERLEWKGYGFDLVVTIDPRGERHVNLKYDMALRDRVSGDEHLAMTRYGMSGECVVALDSPTWLGTIDFASEATLHSGVAILAGIPIIGPLFRDTRSDNGKTYLYLVVQVARDDGGELRTGLTDLVPGAAGESLH